MCMKKADPQASVCVADEYGVLNETIVGKGNGFCGRASVDYENMMFGDTSLKSSLDSENNSLISSLESAGVKVLRPASVTSDDIRIHYGQSCLDYGFDQSFPRNNGTIIANDLIEFEQASLRRKTDFSGLYQIFNDKSKDPNMCWYSTPHAPLLSIPDDYPLLNGNDIIFLNDRILVGIGKYTNIYGYKWLRNTFSFHDVIAIELADGVKYLSHALSVVRPGLAMICRNALKSGIPSFMKDWKIIDISDKERLSLVTDALPLGDNRLLIGTVRNTDISGIIKALESEGISCITVPFDAHVELGGSVRGATFVTHRTPFE